MNLKNVLGQIETYHRNRHVPSPLFESHARSCDQAATWGSGAVHPNMAAPERFADRPDSSCTAGAIHTCPFTSFATGPRFGRLRGTADIDPHERRMAR